MYRTPEGERCLQGAEAELFVEALGFVVDLLRDEDQSFGVDVVDQLQHGQKLVVLEAMASALLCADVPPVQLTAAIEGAVAVVFQIVSECLQGELDFEASLLLDDDGNDDYGDEEETPSHWRHLVLAACQETGIADELPLRDSTDIDEWQLLVECLAGRILWDEDWIAADFHLDLEPETAAAIKSAMGVDGDYFTAIPRDPRDAETPALIARLQDLTRSCR